MKKHGALLFLLLTATPLAAQETAPAAPAMAVSGAPTVEAKALELAKILNSERIIVGTDQEDAKVATLFNELAQTSPELSKFSKGNPQFAQEVMSAILPIMNHHLRQRLPELQKRQAALYAKHFTVAELTYLVGFYRSPTGQKMIEHMIANMKSEAMLEEAKNSPDFKISGEAAIKDVRATVPSVLAQLTAEDFKVLGELGRSTAAPKLRALAVQTQTVALDWYAESGPGEDEAIEAEIIKIIAKYEKAGAKK